MCSSPERVPDERSGGGRGGLDRRAGGGAFFGGLERRLCGEGCHLSGAGGGCFTYQRLVSVVVYVFELLLHLPIYGKHKGGCRMRVLSLWGYFSIEWIFR